MIDGGRKAPTGTGLAEARARVRDASRFSLAQLPVASRDSNSWAHLSQDVATGLIEPFWL